VFREKLHANPHEAQAQSSALGSLLGLPPPSSKPSEINNDIIVHTFL